MFLRGETMLTIPPLLVGLALATLGRKLFWLFVAGVGFLAALSLASPRLGGSPGGGVGGVPRRRFPAPGDPESRRLRPRPLWMARLPRRWHPGGNFGGRRLRLGVDPSFVPGRSLACL